MEYTGLHLIIFSARWIMINHNFYSEFWTAKYHDHVKNYDDQSSCSDHRGGGW